MAGEGRPSSWFFPVGETSFTIPRSPTPLPTLPALSRTLPIFGEVPKIRGISTLDGVGKAAKTTRINKAGESLSVHFVCSIIEHAM